MSLLATIFLSVGSPAIIEHCPLLPGVEVLAEQPQIQWIIVGEQHGTVETPVIFGDLVCNLALSRKIVVGLEMPASMQMEIDRFTNSEGGEKARAEFLQLPFWHTRMKDGRSSKAMFALLERLRQMRRCGVIQGVVAFAPAQWPGTAARYEELMADNVRGAVRSGQTFVALVGSIHALRTHWQTNGTPYMPMAGLLPGGQSATFKVVADGGSNWACTASDECGPKAVGNSRPVGERKLVFGRAPDLAYSGIIAIGGPVSASPPHVQE